MAGSNQSQIELATAHNSLVFVLIINDGLGIRKNLFTLRVVKQQNRLPRELVDAPCLLLSKKHLYKVLLNILLPFVSPEDVRSRHEIDDL